MARGEGIKHITDLFETYRKRLVAPKRSVIDAFCEVVKDIQGFDIDATLVSYTPGAKTLALRAKGPIKTEILLRKEEILVHLKGRLGERNAPRDII